MIPLALALAAVPALCSVGAPIERPRVGFIWHFPFVDVGTQHMGASGATSNIARVPWVAVQPEPSRWDFTCLQRQITEAEKGGFGLVLLFECNPFCSPHWLKEQVRAAGESACGPNGAPSDIPSTTSRVFENAQREMIRRTLSEVERLDKRRVITHYQFGVEWWFPPEHRYAPADIARFRAWLERRYRSVRALNEAWGTTSAAFATVEPPRLAIGGKLWERGRGGLAAVESAGAAPVGRAAAHDWATFWHEDAAGYVNRLASLGRQLGPDRPTISFLTFSFAQGAEWDYVDWSAIRLDAVCRQARDITEIGMQLPAARGDAFRIAVGLDLARKYRKPMNVIDLLDFTDGVKAGRTVHERATQIAIQHGAAALYYCCWNGAKDFNFHPDWPLADIEDMVGGAVRQLERSRALDVVADGAIVLPIMPGAPGTEGQRGQAATSFMGWYKMLQAMGRTVDVVTFSEIEHGCSLRHKWILLPAADIASRKAIERLGRLPGSTKLVVAGDGPREDERGNPITNPLPRARRIGDFGQSYAGPLTRDAAAGDTPPMVMWRKQTTEHIAVLERVRSETEGLLPLEAGNARLIGAPHTVTCITRRGPGRIAVHLVNLDDGPADGIAVSIPGLDGRSVDIICDGLGVETDVRTDRQGMIRVPPFRTSCLLLASTRQTRRSANPPD